MAMAGARCQVPSRPAGRSVCGQAGLPRVDHEGLQGCESFGRDPGRREREGEGGEIIDRDSAKKRLENGLFFGDFPIPIMTSRIYPKMGFEDL